MTDAKTKYQDSVKKTIEFKKIFCVRYLPRLLKFIENLEVILHGKLDNLIDENYDFGLNSFLAEGKSDSDLTGIDKEVYEYIYNEMTEGKIDFGYKDKISLEQAFVNATRILDNFSHGMGDK
jgi:hypothetical protein